MDLQEGSVGTDLNAIPAFAIEKIEVLRDGASLIRFWCDSGYQYQCKKSN
jgi:hypothetical protein